MMLKLGPIALPLLILGGCGHPHGLGRGDVLLQVSATGDSETRPDLATFTAGVSTIAPTSQAATAGNATKMNAVMAAVEAQGVKRDDTQTQALTVSRIDYGANRGKFEATNTVRVKVRKIDSAGQVIGVVTAAGANVLSGPDLTVDDREAASLSAYAAAYKAARARADTYAKAAGLKVDRILSITDGGPLEVDPEEAMNAVAEAPRMANGAPPIRAGMNTSTASVTVRFALRR